MVPSTTDGLEDFLVQWYRHFAGKWTPFNQGLKPTRFWTWPADITGRWARDAVGLLVSFGIPRDQIWFHGTTRYYGRTESVRLIRALGRFLLRRGTLPSWSLPAIASAVQETLGLACSMAEDVALGPEDWRALAKGFSFECRRQEPNLFCVVSADGKRTGISPVVRELWLVLTAHGHNAVSPPIPSQPLGQLWVASWAQFDRVLANPEVQQVLNTIQNEIARIPFETRLKIIAAMEREIEANLAEATALDHDADVLIQMQQQRSEDLRRTLAKMRHQQLRRELAWFEADLEYSVRKAIDGLLHPTTEPSPPSLPLPGPCAAEVQHTA